MAATDVFVDAGIALHAEGRLADGLELLAARLDYAGAGELLSAICGVVWVEEPRGSKGNPQPQPKPPPDPPKPPPDPKGWRS